MRRLKKWHWSADAVLGSVFAVLAMLVVFVTVDSEREARSQAECNRVLIEQLQTRSELGDLAIDLTTREQAALNTYLQAVFERPPGTFYPLRDDPDLRRYYDKLSLIAKERSAIKDRRLYVPLSLGDCD